MCFFSALIIRPAIFKPSGQISSRPHTFPSPQKVAKVREIPKISGKSRLEKYYSIWPETMILREGLRLDDYIAQHSQMEGYPNK